MSENSTAPMPRYVARVGPRRMFKRYGGLASPSRPLAWVTEPADLRGIQNPAESMLKSGWKWEWIEPLIGEEIALCILDTWAEVGPSGEKMIVAPCEWRQLAEAAITDPVMCTDMEAIGIDRHRMVRLFQSLSMTPAGATPYGPEKDVSDQALELRRALERRFATTVLYIGIGAFWREHRKLGGRALWVLPNGTDYRFTPDNHRLVDLGKLCPEHLAEPPVEIERSCHDELELSRKGTEIRLRAREVGNRAVRNRELWLDGGNAAALADALDACLRDETPATINHCNDTLSILASGPEPRPSYFIQNRRAAPCPHPGIFSLAIDTPSAANLAAALHKSP